MTLPRILHSALMKPMFIPAPEKYHTAEILSATIKQLYYVNKKEQILIL